MITVRVSFLLAISLKQDEKLHSKTGKSKKKKPAKNRKGKSAKKSNKSKKSKKSSKTKKSSPGRIPEEDLNYSVLEVEKPLSYIHIEYELFPKRFKYGVDIVCWGPVAKIYTANDSKCLRTVVQNDIAWVPVFMEHYLNHPPTEEIRGYLNYVIPFTIKIGKNYVKKQIHKDKISKFYEYKIEDESDCFSEVYTQKPPSFDSQEFMLQEIAKILKKILVFPMQRSVETWLHSSNPAHTYKIATIMNKRFRGEIVHCKDFYLEENASKTSKKGKSKKGGKKRNKSKKKSKSKSKSKSSSKSATKQVVNFKIPAYILLSDPVLATFQLKETDTSITEGYILLSSENMLTLNQKHELNPLVVKIRKINNFPLTILEQYGFKGVYAKCLIPGVTEFSTYTKPPSNVIRFEESRFICTRDVPPMKILELLQTRRATIEVFGVKDLHGGTKPTNSAAKGKKSKKSAKKKQGKKKSSKLSKKEGSVSNDSTLLAVATLDLSFLDKNFFLFKEKRQCYNLCSIFPKDPPNLSEHFLDEFTVNEINLMRIDSNKSNSSLLNNDGLILDNTTIKFEAHFLIPQFPSFYLKDVHKAYKRFFIIIFDEDVAKTFLNTLIVHNHRCLGAGPLLVANIMANRKYTPTPSQGDADSNNLMLSGFYVDDGNCFIAFVEGLSHGFILTMLHLISNYNYPVAKVFYNSEYLFEDRLYMNFFNNLGFYCIVLKIPFTEILEKPELYYEGNVPIPCFTAIRKLHLILNSMTFKSILSYEILPTEIELSSFAIEFGLSMEHTSNEPSEGGLINAEKSVVLMSHPDLFTNSSYFVQ